VVYTSGRSWPRTVRTNLALSTYSIASSHGIE